MAFIADLHIHSRFSMATSRALTPGLLAAWAAIKGISVLGTGDFTHPGWRQELRENLAEVGDSGLFRLKEASLPEISIKPGLDSDIKFCLQAEVCSIYKSDGKTRKIHNLLFAPDFETAEKISARLAPYGHLASDGRPMLKLSARDVLEITLESSQKAVLIPAHIWTPWYSLFGSRSGFNTIEECFGDLTSHIFALETGLSSDPVMNRHLSVLDNYALISNSDAHSGQNLGREANFFTGKPSYAGMFNALRATAARIPQTDLSCQYMGTLEFYPEEGKYHLDGHRKCGVVLTPAQTRETGGICPVCGKPLTIGVLHRVMELADRPSAPTLALEPPQRMLAPLPMILAEILGVKPGAIAVKKEYERIITNLAPELEVLCELPVSEIYDWHEPLGEAINRMRQGNIIIDPGYDGRFGEIRIFSRSELAEIRKKWL